jgi:predicted MFS family arabinose efflux permease
MTPPEPEAGPSTALVTIVTIAAGALIANLYYAQPLIAQIAPDIGIQPALAGTVVGVTQIGFGLGLFFLVSLADLIENRRLALIMLGGTLVGLIGVATARNQAIFFASSLLIGLCSTGAQVLLPFLTHLIPPQRRGRVVGNVMAGVLTGVMLARPIALFIAGPFGWRAVFWCSAALTVFIGAMLMRIMPRHHPRSGMHYGQILVSMATLMRDTPGLRHRAAYQALLFGAFNMFWTVSPLMLADHFHLSAHQIGIFALVGVGGALSAPIAGRMADRGRGGIATIAAMVAVGACFYATNWAAQADALILLATLAILIDGAVQTNQVVSQKIIFSVPPQVRGRANALYMTSIFVGGAAGSIIGAYAYHQSGWPLTATLGGLTGAAAVALFLLWERRPAGAPVSRASS